MNAKNTIIIIRFLSNVYELTVRNEDKFTEGFYRIFFGILSKTKTNTQTACVSNCYSQCLSASN